MKNTLKHPFIEIIRFSLLFHIPVINDYTLETDTNSVSFLIEEEIF